MRVFITGVSGFAGRHLAEYCVTQKKAEVHGLQRKSSQRAAASRLPRKIKLWEGELLDFARLKQILKKVKPDRIFHLAAQTSVPSSWANPSEAFRTNVLGTYYLLEAVRELKLSPRIHIASSSEEYGRLTSKEIPVSEKARLRPVSPYGISKVGQDVIGRFYYEAFGLPVVVTRSFSHTGPGQSDKFVAGSFARQIAEIEATHGKRVIYTGNLDNIRDFTDVRDIVRAYWLALEKGKPGKVYNIASSRGIPVKFIAETLVGLARAPIVLKKDKARLRKSDVPRIVGDASKFCRDTGWVPEITAERMLLDLLNDWREKCS